MSEERDACSKKQNEKEMNYPTQLDEIDRWLVDNFGILPGACSSTENLRYSTAKMIAQALWPKEAPQSSIKERYGVILQAAQQAVGKRLAAGRRKEDILIRVFISHRLRQEGYSYEAIGQMMNRDHATIVHYERVKMGSMLSLPKMYREELKMYDKMNEIIDKGRL